MHEKYKETYGWTDLSLAVPIRAHMKKKEKKRKTMTRKTRQVGLNLRHKKRFSSNKLQHAVYKPCRSFEQSE